MISREWLYEDDAFLGLPWNRSIIDEWGKVMAWHPLNSVAAPVSSLAELGKVTMHAEMNFVSNDTERYELMYRGHDSNLFLVAKQLIGLDMRKVEVALKKMLAICRAHFSGTKSANEIYFLMRHAGLPSHIIDWSQSLEVALWFAIHSTDGSLKKDNASLWVLRPTIGKKDRVATFYPADCMACERSKRQKGFAYFLHFTTTDDGVLTMLPMESDPIYGPRLLRIPLQGDYSAMERELCERDPSIAEIAKAESPLPENVVEKCRKVFQTITKKKA